MSLFPLSSLLSELLSQNQAQIRGLLTPDESFTYLEYSSSDLESQRKDLENIWQPSEWFIPKVRLLTSQQGTPWFRGAFHYARGEQANGKFYQSSAWHLLRPPSEIAARIPESADVV
jgi:hypothetical protein